MMDTKFTPGPWWVGEERHGYDCIVRSVAKNDPIASTAMAGYPKAMARANAHLIAAAPELYAALEKIVFDWDGEPEDIADALAALKKARGEIAANSPSRRGMGEEL